MAAGLEETLDPKIAADIVEIGRLSALPQATMELMTLLSDERTDAAQLQKTVERDPALSSKVISLGNSAYYGARAATIAQAITLIGFQDLRFLALGLGLADTFDLRHAPADYDAEGLWLHSLAVAWAARETAATAGLADPGEAMLAGLLHNIGQIMLVTHFTPRLQEILRFMTEGHSFREGEIHFDLRHEVIGYHLARHWNLPPHLQEVILHHHQPESAGEGRPQAEIVNLAVEMTALTDFRLEYEISPEGSPDYWSLLPRISRPAKEKLLEKIQNALPLLAPVWLQILPPSTRRRSGRTRD